jgi:hypothetical protein
VSGEFTVDGLRIESSTVQESKTSRTTASR